MLAESWHTVGVLTLFIQIVFFKLHELLLAPTENVKNYLSTSCLCRHYKLRISGGHGCRI
jgi:hypothetical protein